MKESLPFFLYAVSREAAFTNFRTNIILYAIFDKDLHSINIYVVVTFYYISILFCSLTYMI